MSLITALTSDAQHECQSAIISRKVSHIDYKLCLSKTFICMCLTLQSFFFLSVRLFVLYCLFSDVYFRFVVILLLFKINMFVVYGWRI